MKRVVLLAACFLAGLTVIATPTERPVVPVTIQQFLETNSTGTRVFDAFLGKLAGKRSAYKHEKDFTRYIFTKTHQVILKRYAEYVPFESLFTTGTYNCLTGTILYSLILTHFNIEHSIIETNYHIFLIAHTDQGDVLMEATDPIHGFVSAPSAVEAKLAVYRERSREIRASREGLYQFTFNLFREVSPSELLGLVHYNLSIEAFNQRKLEKAVAQLLEAARLYRSERISEFAGILVQAIAASDWSADQQTRSTQQLASLLPASATLVASLN